MVMSQALARIVPGRDAGGMPADRPAQVLSNREKAAVIVRLLMAEGVPLPLSSLPGDVQAALAEQIAGMRVVDRATLRAVVAEFLTEIERFGIAFPGGIEGALALLDGHISADTAGRLRRQARSGPGADPWARIGTTPAEGLLAVLEEESPEVGAVVLSKLPVAVAADLLGRLPGERARRLAHAVARTGDIMPGTVARIGTAIAARLDSLPPKAFEARPDQRVGAMLNLSAAATRDALLEGLQADDAAFAEKVRRAIFTFAHIPARLGARDVPRVVRALDQPVLITALAGATAPDTAAAAEFILSNMSQRLAGSLREEMAGAGPVRGRAAEEAMNAVVGAIRRLEGAGEIELITPEEEEDTADRDG